MGWPLGGCVTIQSLYHDKRTAWLWACHDTIDCIMTVGQRGMVVGCVAIQHGQGCDTASGKGLGCDTNFVSSLGEGLRYAYGRATQGHYTAA